ASRMGGRGPGRPGPPPQRTDGGGPRALPSERPLSGLALSRRSPGSLISRWVARPGRRGPRPATSEGALLAQARGEAVAEGVAQHVEPEDGERDGDPGPDRHPGRAQHVSPA